MPDRFYRFIFTFLLLAVFSPAEKAIAWQDDGHIEFDLESEWLVYNSRLDSYAPFINRSAFSGNTISFVLKRDDYERGTLRICFQEGSSLFIEQKIIDVFSKSACQTYNVDSLFREFDQDDLFFTVYNKTFDLDKITTHILQKVDVSAGEEIISGQYFSARNKGSFKNFYILALLIFLVLLSFAYNLNPRNFRQFWSLRKIIDFKLTYDKVHGLRVMNWANLIIVFAHCMLIAYLLMVVFHLLGDPIVFLKTNVESTLLSLWKWLMLSAIVFVVVMMKYFLIKILANLMQFREMENIHFFEFIRISIFIYVLALIVVLFNILSFYNPQSTRLEWIIFGVAILSVVRIILLYFKFLRLTTFRNFYLFSYLCTTEILPLIIGFKIFVLRFIG